MLVYDICPEPVLAKTSPRVFRFQTHQMSDVFACVQELGDHVNAVLHEGCAASNGAKKRLFCASFVSKNDRSIYQDRFGTNTEEKVVQKKAFYAGTITLLRSITAKAKQLGKKLLYQCHTTGGMDNNTVASFLVGAGVDHCACAHKTRWLRSGVLDVTTYRQFTQTSSGWRLTNGRVFCFIRCENQTLLPVAGTLLAKPPSPTAIRSWTGRSEHQQPTQCTTQQRRPGRVRLPAARK
jgi:hypothetical protein